MPSGILPECSDKGFFIFPSCQSTLTRRIFSVGALRHGGKKAKVAVSGEREARTRLGTGRRDVLGEQVASRAPLGRRRPFFFFFFFFFRRAGVLWHDGKIKKSFVRVLWRGYQRANPGTRVLSHGDSTVSDPKIAARRFIHGLISENGTIATIDSIRYYLENKTRT